MKETIFDHSITMEELKFLFTLCKTKEEYLLNTSPKKRMHDLYILFTLREDWYKAEAIKKIILNQHAAHNSIFIQHN